MKDMTLLEAVELGYLHRQGRYKGAPWICNSRQYPDWRKALAAANESMRRHAPPPSPSGHSVTALAGTPIRDRACLTR